MKELSILVCLKQVPDTTEVRLTDSLTLERDFVAQVMNPADESALELALRLRDSMGGRVTALTMGPARAETMLREALARGADQAVLMTDPAFAGADTLITARSLSACVHSLDRFDLILCGRRAIDGETGQVGPMLAALNGWACVSNAVAAEADGDALRVTQLTEHGQVIWQTPLPALVTLCEWSYRLRLPTIMGLRRAARAEVRRITAESLGLSREDCGLRASPTRVTKVSARPVGVRPCRMLAPETAVEVLEREGVLRP